MNVKTNTGSSTALNQNFLKINAERDQSHVIHSIGQQLI